ncbi:hypothetical protein K435DRAFT_793025 [Dendrothele bispora CBS 962.96]|uniref:Uncharacterized protein n=1 Tax=Dendrothele bispora (strain CBS 962.96) TaxID=1314807 RepID=A0A4S8MGL0_DENBC|nr:hypothetical protein K435DRAFT_793025 [Dendrothele bispora CBS 962.96]
MTFIPCKELDISVLEAAVEELREKTNQPAIECFDPKTINRKWAIASRGKYEAGRDSGCAVSGTTHIVPFDFQTPPDFPSSECKSLKTKCHRLEVPVSGDPATL